MILRRVIAHFRKQEWTAIAIDFIIVVVGVFVGMQVTNWNAARVEKAQEMAMLAQLRNEILANADFFDAQTDYMRAGVEGGVRGLAFLEGGVPCAANCADLVVDFFHASQVWGTDYETAVFRENERRGFPSDPATRDVVQKFYQSLTGWSIVNLTPPPFRERVRGHFSPAASAVLWDKCFDIPEDRLVETLSRDCVGDLDADESARMLEAIRADGALADMLRFWIGQNTFAVQEQPRLRADAASAVAALAKAAERAK
jgi:hypothetical protein